MERGIVIALALATVAGLSFAGLARAADAGSPAPVSRLSLMPIGTFSFDAGGSTSVAGSLVCDPGGACGGVFGFGFPVFTTLGQVTGSTSCAPSEAPTACTIAFTSGDLFACSLTVYPPALPGVNNPFDVTCSNPAGHGHGQTTLTILS